MQKGIKLSFTDEDTAEVAVEPEGEMCYGGVICPHCQRRIDKIGNHTIYPYWCLVTDQSVVQMDRCPENRWQVLAKPEPVYKDFTEEI